MNIKKCNSCGKVLEPKKDEYYSIDEISFHSPKCALTRVGRSKECEDASTFYHEESWLEYMDLDFCPECFDKESIKRYLR